MSESKQQVAMVALDKIQENEAALRSVDKQSESFQGLLGSIKEMGVLLAICVSPIKDPETGKATDEFRLVDGLQRFSAAQDAGMSEIPCTIQDMDETEAYYAQIVANAHKVETKPAEYASHLQRILSGNPTMTMNELAGKLNKTGNWLGGMLKLNKLAESVAELVDDNKITLMNAQSLSKLPAAEQMEWLEAAQTESPAEFAPKIADRAREIRKAAREGREPEDTKFSPVERCRKLAELKELRNDPAAIVKAAGAAGAKDLVAFTMDYVLSMDPESVKVQEAKDVERKATREEDKKKRKVERTEAKAKQSKEDAETARKKYDADQAKAESGTKTPAKK